MSERICRAILELITGARFLKVRPLWLRNERGNVMELDGYAPELKLAFEYQGLQHYKWERFFHESVSAFNERQANDVVKQRLCRERGITLLQVPYFIPHPKLQRFLENSLRRLSPNVILNETPIDITKLAIWRAKNMEELRALAISRGGRVVSNHYINNSTRVRWRCSETHEWEATPASVRRGSWCPKCGDRRAAIKRAHTIEEMIYCAAARGGECLSHSYVNSRSRLWWRCAAGHEWETQASVILSGHWCPKCEKIRLGRRYALSLEQIQRTAKERGGECLSQLYSNTREKLTWRCARGHTWLANANSVRRGAWCPVCARKR